MNNPFNRKMFRQAGMSKQPIGILASSPELMTTAEKALMSGQPVRAQNGQVVRVDRDRLSEYQNPNTGKRMGQGVLDALSGKSSYKYVNAVPIKDNESPLGVGLKSVGNVLNIAPPYIKDNILAAGKYLGKSRDYELTQEQLARKVASENAGKPVKITDGKFGITKDIPEGFKYSSVDDTQAYIGADSPMFQEGMERIRANELAEYKAGVGEKLAKVRSGEVTNTEKKVTSTDKKSDKVGGETFKGTGKLSDKRSDQLSLVTKNVFAEHRALEKREGMVLPLKLSTVGKGMKNKALEVLSDKDIDDDTKAGTVFEILKGKKANPKTLKKDIKAMLEDMSGKKPGVTTTAGYNLMMTGLLIAAGDSPDALTNIARGAAQGLQGYGKAMEKERAVEAETDLLAGKLAVGEFLAQEKEGRQKSDFVYGSDFTDKDGTVYKAGDAIKASSDQIISLQQMGVDVVAKETYNNAQKLLTAVAGKKTKNDGVEVTNKQFATDIDYLSGTQVALKNNAMAVESLDKNIKNLAKDGQTIVGGASFIQKIKNSFAGFKGSDVLDKADLDAATFDTDVDTALITYAVALLGEGGKDLLVT